MDHDDRLLEVELSGSLNVRRTVLHALEVVAARAVDWAAIVVVDRRADSVTLYGGRDRRQVTSSRPAPTTGALAELVRGGPLLRLRLDGSDEVAVALASLLPHPDLAGEVLALGDGGLLALPLRARGTLLGAIVVARRADPDRDEAFAPASVETFHRYAARAALALDSARTYEEHAHVTRVLEQNLRPSALPHIPGVEVATSIRSSAEQLELGGDFYDVHGEEGDWIVVLGDVCGKGVDAAVLNSRARQSIRTAARFDRSPDQILTTLNDVLYDDTSDKFVTVVCARIRPRPDGSVAAAVATAGHPAPLLVRVDGTVEQPDVSGRLAGVIRHEDGHPEVEVLLAPGDAMMMFSDGLYEARGVGGEYGMDRLRQVVARYAGAGAAAMCEAVEQDVVEHLDGGAHDDMTVLVLAARPGVGS